MLSSPYTILTLLALFIPSITACREASISGEISYNYGKCPTVDEALKACDVIKDALVRYSLRRNNAWGHHMTAEAECPPCPNPNHLRALLCTCTVTAHNYREWLPGIQYSEFKDEPGLELWTGTSSQDHIWVVYVLKPTRDCD